MEKNNKTDNNDLQKDVNQNPPSDALEKGSNEQPAITGKDEKEALVEKNINPSDKKEVQENTNSNEIINSEKADSEPNNNVENTSEKEITQATPENQDTTFSIDQKQSDERDRLEDAEQQTINLQTENQELNIKIEELKESSLKQSTELIQIVKIRDNLKEEKVKLGQDLNELKEASEVEKQQSQETLDKVKEEAETNRKRLVTIGIFSTIIAFLIGYGIGDYFNWFGQSTEVVSGNQGIVSDSLNNQVDSSLIDNVIIDPDGGSEEKPKTEEEKPDDKDDNKKPDVTTPKPDVVQPKPSGSTFATKMKKGISRKGYYTETVTYKGVEFDVFAADISKLKLRIHWQNSRQTAYSDIKTMKEALESSGAKKVFFATNGGIFSDKYTPEGLFIYKGKTIEPLNTKDGRGNFYLKPNGVFVVDKNQRAHIVTTNYYKSLSQQTDIEYAVQSGPMLSINGKTHSAFGKTSTNKYIRSGVGIPHGGSTIVVFAITKQPCNFYTFSKLYQEQLGCKNALYLDGAISEMYINDPTSNRKDLGGNFVTIINISAQ